MRPFRPGRESALCAGPVNLQVWRTIRHEVQSRTKIIHGCQEGGGDMTMDSLTWRVAYLIPPDTPHRGVRSSRQLDKDGLQACSSTAPLPLLQIYTSVSD